ncbi:MAG: hypothetical protein ACYDFT_02470 [Thermoplasmata archaeon]
MREVSPPRLLAALEAIQVASIVLAVAVGAFVLAGGSSAEFQCATFPRCLLAPSNPLALAHTGSAGVLLLLCGAAVLLAARVRRTDPALLGWTTIGFLVLVAMAALGAAFATGEVPTDLAGIQIVLLGLLVALLGAGMLRTRSAARGLAGDLAPPDRVDG